MVFPRSARALAGSLALASGASAYSLRASSPVWFWQKENEAPKAAKKAEDEDDNKELAQSLSKQLTKEDADISDIDKQIAALTKKREKVTKKREKVSALYHSLGDDAKDEHPAPPPPPAAAVSVVNTAAATAVAADSKAQQQAQAEQLAAQQQHAQAEAEAHQRAQQEEQQRMLAAQKQRQMEEEYRMRHQYDHQADDPDGAFKDLMKEEDGEDEMNDPAYREAAAALSKSTGWDESVIEGNANRSVQTLTRAIGGKKVVGALKGMLGAVGAAR